EVVHGKGSMLGKMHGDEWQKFAGLRNLYAYQWAYPGKKLLFMGNEFGQRAEWNHDRSLDWRLLEDEPHEGLRRLVRDLNKVYRHFPALYEQDCEPAGFEWLVHDDVKQSVFAFVRRGKDGACVVAVCNFTPVVREAYRLGLPEAGTWREVLNTDQQVYGGSGVGNGLVNTEAVPWHGQAQSAAITVPPLATVMWVRA
ncbi:MAG: 1,4-alpha-glucan branching enzyme, partial [Comamonadaceae bacterium]